MASIRVPTALRTFTSGASEIEITATTVREALAELDRRHPGIAAKLLDGAGAVKPFIRIFVGSDDIGELGGLDAPVGERDEISIIPAIAGGRDEVVVRDDQVRRYARHILLPEVGGLGQTALIVATARLELREREPEPR